jgi:HK97 gp10 family phage protein
MFKDLEKFFNMLGDKYAKKIERKAVRKVAKIVAEEMKKQMPMGETGNLEKAVQVRRPKRARRGSIVYSALVSASKLMALSGKDYPYFMAVEYGTKTMSPDPFIRPAAGIVQPQMKSIFLQESKRILSEEMPKGYVRKE